MTETEIRALASLCNRQKVNRCSGESSCSTERGQMFLAPGTITVCTLIVFRHALGGKHPNSNNKLCYTRMPEIFHVCVPVLLFFLQNKDALGR